MSENPYADSTTAELDETLAQMRKKLRRLEKDPLTRHTMLTAATATEIRNLAAEIEQRCDQMSKTSGSA